MNSTFKKVVEILYFFVEMSKLTRFFLFFKIVMQKVARLAKKLEELRQRFLTEGPSSENMSLEEGLNSLTQFRFDIQDTSTFKSKNQNINHYNLLTLNFYTYTSGSQPSFGSWHPLGLLKNYGTLTRLKNLRA